MEKIFKYILAILVVCTLVGIFVALNNPRPKLTFNDKIRLSKIIAECNMDLPREIGTIGYLDSMSFADETITYAVSVKGDDRIMQVYSDNYDEFKDMLKYSFIEMNGQRNLGNTFAHSLETKGLNICWRTRQTLWSAVQMLTQKLCCQTIHDCPKVVPLHYESE